MILSGLIFGIYPLSVAGTPFGLVSGLKIITKKLKLLSEIFEANLKSYLLEVI